MCRSLDFSYHMEIAFSAPASNHQFTLRIVPRDDARQRIVKCGFLLQPECALSKDTDAFGNMYIFGTASEPHERFAVTVEGRALVDQGKYQGEEHRGMRFPHYRYQSGFTKPGRAILEYYRMHERRAGEDGAAFAMRILRALYEDMEYVQGVTDINTAAEEAFAARRGVCQDYAHIMLSLCRLADVPCRYVVGMMMGEGYSHAWVEVFSGGFWRGLDPTNGREADDTYIKISHGRDYKDCIVNRGVFNGGGTQTQTVRVVVRESAG